MNHLDSLSRLLVIAGGVLVTLGGLLWLMRRLGPLGRLPGDIVIQRPNFTFYFPLMTSIILSLLLTLAINLLIRR